MNDSPSSLELAHIERDNEGFLLDPEDWNRGVAQALAAEAGLELTDAHWQVIDFIRDSFETSQVVPEARKLLRHLKSTLGAEQATRRYVYHLFPTGYGQTACKIAGMRKPLKLMLDV